MGGNYFDTISWGKDAQDAFARARERDLSEYIADQEADRDYDDEPFQYEGYSGTVAEKDSFYSFEKPARMSTRALLSAAMTAYDAGQAAGTRPVLAWNGTYKVWANGKARTRKANQLQKIAALRAARTYDDKWGPAACFEVTGKEAQEFKARHGLTGKRNVKVFCFFSVASC